MDKTGIGLALLERTPELVIAFSEDGTICFGNGSALEKLNYTEEELTGRSMSELFVQEFRNEDGTYLPFELERLSGKEELAIYRKNSSCFLVFAKFVRGEEGLFYLFAEDISFQKSTDARIRRLQDEEQTNRRIRNEFTANVTHELRTPVNGIKGHVTSLLDKVEDEEQRKILEIILYCCDNMSAIINNILDFSKLEAGKFLLEEGEFDFYKMMDCVISTHIAEINKKELGIRVYIDKSIPQYLIGDSLRVSQILNNLLSNAVKFTLIGQISVDVNRTMQTGDELELFFMVRDSGIGMSKEEQSKLFQSFRQADASITRRFGGTGLGLSITKQLVEMMNGSIFVESEKGKGSCFSFSIRLHTSKKEDVGGVPEALYKKWASSEAKPEKEFQGDLFEFGSEGNRAELKKRMEKLALSIELGSWDRAETLASTVKALLESAGGDLRKLLLRLEMELRKGNYEKSMAAYEKLKAALEEQTRL